MQMDRTSLGVRFTGLLMALYDFIQIHISIYLHLTFNMDFGCVIHQLLFIRTGGNRYELFIRYICRKKLKRLGIEETKFEWGGELYSQEPKQYFNKSGLDFQEFLDVEYYKKYHSNVLEYDLDLDDYIAIRLMGSDALRLEVLVNTDVESIKSLN